MVLRKKTPRGTSTQVWMFKARLEKWFSMYEVLGNIS